VKRDREEMQEPTALPRKFSNILSNILYRYIAAPLRTGFGVLTAAKFTEF
jgi:hypothetical protein